MSKYDPLLDFLGTQTANAVNLSFARIEQILGTALPRSARRYPAFWSAGNMLGQLLRARGWHASLRRAEQAVEFTEQPGTHASRLESVAARKPPRATAAEPTPDVMLIGCVKRKREGRHRAAQLYTSPLFDGRRRWAEHIAAPWFILSAHYGLVAPDEMIESYDLTLADLYMHERKAWSERVLKDLERRFGPLSGCVVEIHASAKYHASGLIEGLTARGANVRVPLEGLRLEEQIAWYAGTRSSGRTADNIRTASPEPRQISTASSNTPAYVRAVVKALNHEFRTGALDLHERPGAPVPGWATMPEFLAVERLRGRGASTSMVRIFLTLVAALDRARDAYLLWARAARLHATSPWVFDLEEVRKGPLIELRDTLAKAGVSQRHSIDSAGWRVIAESLSCPTAPPPVPAAVFDGSGDAATLLADVRGKTDAGQARFPLLSGPKVSVIWVRLMAAPGKGDIANLSVLPVAVDVQVRKVTENLGITRTQGVPIEAARSTIQDAWRAGAAASEGPGALAGTGAALDPALWFFAKWGCSYCEHKKAPRPIGSVCDQCAYNR